ncbi:STAS domain-containing protein [Streptomyces gardneri]|uniref:STAS domain-containing protein n=1 Tax=Nocardia sp. CY15 TaxID=2608687 RepID=UPI001357EF48|nr:STAS domain-containing protein [Streptomyces gardneri]
MDSPSDPCPSNSERPPAAGLVADPRTRLSSSLRRQGPAVVMSTRGIADAFTLNVWQQDISRAVECAEASSCGLVVDTTKLEFLSCRAVKTLAREADRCRSGGTSVSLVSPSPAIARIAAADPVMARLPIHSTVVSALTALLLRPPRPHHAMPRTARLTAQTDSAAPAAGFRRSGSRAQRRESTPGRVSPDDATGAQRPV